MSVCCARCVFSGRGLCDELINRPEGSYRLWCVAVCDLETSWKRRPWAHWGVVAPKEKNWGNCNGIHPFMLSHVLPSNTTNILITLSISATCFCP